MPPFVPRPRAVRDIDRQLAGIKVSRAQAWDLIERGVALLEALRHDEDSLLELRTAEAARRA